MADTPELDRLLADLRRDREVSARAAAARYAAYTRSLRGRLHDAAGYAPAPIHRLLRAAASLCADRRAATSLEYGIIAGVLGLALIAAFHGLDKHLSTLFATIGRAL